jgi:hypothetical protein
MTKATRASGRTLIILVIVFLYLLTISPAHAQTSLDGLWSSVAGDELL